VILLGGLLGVVLDSIWFERFQDSGVSARLEVVNRSWVVKASIGCSFVAYSERCSHPLEAHLF
jgi:hypothetical protein